MTLNHDTISGVNSILCQQFFLVTRAHTLLFKNSSIHVAVVPPPYWVIKWVPPGGVGPDSIRRPRPVMFHLSWWRSAGRTGWKERGWIFVDLHAIAILLYTPIRTVTWLCCRSCVLLWWTILGPCNLQIWQQIITVSIKFDVRFWKRLTLVSDQFRGFQQMNSKLSSCCFLSNPLWWFFLMGAKKLEASICIQPWKNKK